LRAWAAPGEDYALQNTKALSLPAPDTRKPLNLDHSDLHPDIKELPPFRQGWTPMLFMLIKID
jgi:hypothetical protein